jgi:catechol-2,3-dioxygenase
MPVHRLNHAVLYVRNVERSVEFYNGVFGFEPVNMTPEGFRGAAFLQAPGSTNDHDLGLFELGDGAAASPAGRTSVGLYHLAWEVDTLADLERIAVALAERGALVGASDHGTTKSLYGKDPDGLEFEVVWLIPKDLLDDAALSARKRIGPLDLEREKERYGAETPGGIGISRPALV